MNVSQLRRREDDWPGNDGLYNTLRSDRTCQVLERVLPHINARLILAFLQVLERNVLQRVLMIAGNRSGI